MTAGDLISGSLRLIGVLATGESASSSEAIDALSSLNDLLDSWSNEKLLAYTKVREVFALTPGQQSYTIGTGGNLNTTRPQRIENAFVQPSSNSPVIEIPLSILNKDQYSSVLQKTLDSSFPLYIYNDQDYPLSSLSFWPVPNTACNVVLYSWKQLANIASLTTTITLPPGYQRALKYNLAIDLANEYGRPLSESIISIALESKAVLKRKNATPAYLQVDDAIRPSPAVWNWKTGGTE